MSLAAVAAPALTIAPAQPAQAAGTVCAVARGFYPNIQGAPTLRNDDTDVNGYIGGDFTALVNAQEAEGTFVVGGDATFDTNARFNLGVVGVGSQVTPPAMSDMLVVGGNVLATATTVLEVGHIIGGNIVSGGTIGLPSQVETNGGTQTPGAATPVKPYEPVAAGYQELSAAYAAMPATGSTVVTGWDITFTGDNTMNRQVFTLNSSDLGSAMASGRSIVFEDIPLGAIVVVNVVGPSVTLWVNSFWDGSTQIVPNAAAPDTTFSQRTQALLWNLADATTVTLGNGDQLPGSMLIPTAGSTTTILTSINGRFYTEGDVEFGGSTQTGLEFHNYPFREEMCAAVATGSLSIAKTLDDPDNVVDAGRVYTGAYTCRDAANAVVASGTWTLAAGAPPLAISPIAAGSVCAVAEDPQPTPSATDASYRWQPAAISPAAAVVTSGATTPVTVHNQVVRALGELEMVKVLDDPYDVVDLSRVYTGSFACSYLGADVTPAPGTWAEVAGAAPVRLATGLPAGTRCTLTEDPIVVPPLPGFPQYHWAAPVISPASVTIAENAVARITVTNIVEDPLDPPVSDPPVSALPTVAVSAAADATPPQNGPLAVLANTGADTLGPLLVAAVMILLGLVGLVVKRYGAQNR